MRTILLVGASASLMSMIAIPAVAQDFSAEIFGGVRFEDNLDYGNIAYDTDNGTIFGLRGLYHATPNLSYGLELNATTANYTGFPSEVNAQSAMAIARYSTPVSQDVDIYGTLGLGAVRVEYDGATIAPSFSGKETVAGGQLTLGAAMEISPKVGLFGELTYQATFDTATIENIDTEYESKNIAVGLRFRF